MIAEFSVAFRSRTVQVYSFCLIYFPFNIFQSVLYYSNEGSMRASRTEKVPVSSKSVAVLSPYDYHTITEIMIEREEAKSIFNKLILITYLIPLPLARF